MIRAVNRRVAGHARPGVDADAGRRSRPDQAGVVDRARMPRADVTPLTENRRLGDEHALVRRAVRVVTGGAASRPGACSHRYGPRLSAWQTCRLRRSSRPACSSFTLVAPCGLWQVEHCILPSRTGMWPERSSLATLSRWHEAHSVRLGRRLELRSVRLRAVHAVARHAATLRESCCCPSRARGCRACGRSRQVSVGLARRRIASGCRIFVASPDSACSRPGPWQVSQPGWPSPTASARSAPSRAARREGSCLPPRDTPRRCRRRRIRPACAAAAGARRLATARAGRRSAVRLSRGGRPPRRRPRAAQASATITTCQRSAQETPSTACETQATIRLLDGMTGLAVLADRLAVLRLVLVVVAAEAARGSRCGRCCSGRCRTSPSCRETRCADKISWTPSTARSISGRARRGDLRLFGPVETPAARGQFRPPPPPATGRSPCSAFTASRWTNGSVVGISPRAIASLTARSGVAAIAWLGRLWQSVQSMRRRSPLAICSGVTPSATYSRTVPSRSVIRT